MRSKLRVFFIASLILVGAQGFSHALNVQEGSGESSSSALPDAPTPMLMAMALEEKIPQNGAARPTTTAPLSEQERHKIAQEQLKEQEHQRILGIVPSFNTTYRPDAVSLTAGQKMGLALRSEIDPFAFAGAFVIAGYHEAKGDDRGFGWGAEGYGKRAGAAYLDAFDGNIIGNGILPALLRQDPRYFRLGYGSFNHRLLYSIATTVICKHDNTGKWEPNYSNIAGNIASGGISNLYYPSGDSGIGKTFSNGMVVTAQGALGSIFHEFWPDFSRKFFHRDPTHGLDAEAAAQRNK